MKGKRLVRTLPLLLCLTLCACATTPAVGASSEEFITAVHLSDYEELITASLSLELIPPTDWSRDSAEVAFAITDRTGIGFASAAVRLGQHGPWQDVTDTLKHTGSQYTGAVEVSDNGTVSLKVTGHDGTVMETSCAVQCFDWSAPTVRAVVDDGKLCIEARDNRSGIASILVDGKAYAVSEQNTMWVMIQELDPSKKQITVQAVDRAGHKSELTTVDNPNYQPPKAEPEPEQEPESQPETESPVSSSPQTSTVTQAPAAPQQTAGKAVSKPDQSAAESTVVSAGASASASVDPEAEADTTPRSDNAFTPDGQGTVVDNGTDAEGKEFFTITTANDNIFYLIIDQQRDSKNVYFLNAVTEEDLLALAEPAANDGESAVSDPEPVCTCGVQCEAGAVDTDCPVCVLSWKDCTGKAPAPTEEEPTESEQEGGGAGTFVVIALAALAAGGAGWYVKIYKPKHELDDAEDFDELIGAEEETINEDDPEYPDEPDYPDDDDDGPEDRTT